MPAPYQTDRRQKGNQANNRKYGNLNSREAGMNMKRVPEDGGGKHRRRKNED
ncbi:hypothetical protein [Bradyrhizobium valentinum]|uniref:hypothetical protein n=1 Tax=Bradyrhizobium valentinum TaxID=1518501 RepID=UPI000A70EF59|nr:hypothetical protein [Bradyrhizobium valentinum]